MPTFLPKPTIQLIYSLLFLLSLSACRIELVKIIAPDGRVEGKYKQIRRTEQRHGFYRLYHENGQLSLEMFYKNGKLQGETKTWYPNGHLESLAHVENDAYEGPFMYWYPTDTLKQEGTYINNDIEGNLKTYYPNGVLKEIVFFSESAENGPYVLYHQNGKIKEEGHFIEGPKLNGLILQYDGEGVLMRKLNCEKNVCDTIWIR